LPFKKSMLLLRIPIGCARASGFLVPSASAKCSCLARSYHYPKTCQGKFLRDVCPCLRGTLRKNSASGHILSHLHRRSSSNMMYLLGYLCIEKSCSPTSYTLGSLHDLLHDHA